MAVDRREFLKKAAASGVGIYSILSAGERNGGASTSTLDIHPDYIRKNIPSIPYPPHEGSWYEDTVPDTLDLAEMADLLVNGLTGPTDPHADYELYFYVNFHNNPPVMRHDWSDQCQMRSMKALPLMRHISGNNLNHPVDQVWMNVVLESIGPDGLYYVSTKGLPWVQNGLMGFVPGGVYKPDGTTVPCGDPSVSQFMYPFYPGYAVGLMTIYYLRDRNPIWTATTKKMVERYSHLSLHRGDYCFLPAAEFEPNARVPANVEMPTGQVAMNTSAWILDGIGKFYKLTGYEPARDLGREVVNYMRHQCRFFDEQGHCYNPQGGFLDNHFHSHSVTLMGMLDYAEAVDDRDLVEYVRSGYEWFKTQGSSISGFFQESIVPDYARCETDEVADMIALALKLTQLGAGDYWDDADRWTRNQFFENQLTAEKSKQIGNLGSRLNLPVRPADGVIFTDDHVAERNIGSFAGWASANEWLYVDKDIDKDGRGGIQHCCTGNAAQTVFYVWKHMLDYREGRLRLNLLFNRASTWADVYSYVPYDGRVDLKIKTECANVLVRAPEWVNPATDKVEGTVNHTRRSLTWEGRYVQLGPAKPGDRVSVTFPISERTVTNQKIGNGVYSLVIKGNTIVSIDPPGKYCPLYERAQYRQSKVTMRNVKRFLPKETIGW